MFKLSNLIGCIGLLIEDLELTHGVICEEVRAFLCFGTLQIAFGLIVRVNPTRVGAFILTRDSWRRGGPARGSCQAVDDAL